tara:strand:- start:2590 stop:2811 length:222 start_codon:yes stop_codon:yes gene_type:complete
MAGIIKTQVTKVKSNMLGAIVGVVAGYYAAGKYGKVTNKYAKIAIAVASGVVVAHAQSYVIAKSSSPTAEQTK